jgi:Leucine-rich repeat (LRR) protein
MSLSSSSSSGAYPVEAMLAASNRHWRDVEPVEVDGLNGVCLELVDIAGSSTGQHCAFSASKVKLNGRRLVRVSENISLLTTCSELYLHRNCLERIPESIFGSMRCLQWARFDSNRITELPAQISFATTLTQLMLGRNQLTTLPRSVKHLVSLKVLSAHHNRLVAVPVELAFLPHIENLDFRFNRLELVPSELRNLPAATKQAFSGNAFGGADEALSEALTSFADAQIREQFFDTFGVVCHLSSIRREAATVCIALQDLELPALLTLLIVDVLFENDIRMWAKWELVTAVKHFRERFLTKPTKR